MATFKILKEPVKPFKRSTIKRTTLYDDFYIKDVIKTIADDNGDINTAFVSCSRDYDDDVEIELTYNHGSDEEYNQQMVEYKLKLADYRKWKKENKYQIQEELRRRKYLREKRKVEKLEREKQELIEKLKKLDNKLDS